MRGGFYEKKVGIVIFLVCIFIGITFFKEDRVSEKSVEYLIDIMIKNEEKINIDYIQMGIILPDGNEEIINTVQGNNANNDMFHFTISYSPDTHFFLKGTSAGKEIEPCFFDIVDYSNVNEPQEIYFYIEDFKIYKE